MVADLGVVMALFLAIALSSLFAGEWHDNTSSLVLTTKNGWGKIAFAKVLTGLAFTVELFTILAIPNILSQIFFMGTSGWDMPIQNIKLIAIAPMNMLQAEIYEYVFALLGAIGFAGVVMFISATMKNNVLALLFSLACVYGPMMIAEYLPYELQKVLDLFADAPNAELTAQLEAVKKKIDEELQLYFPKLFDDATVKEYYDQLKQRTMLMLDAIIKGDESDKREEIDHITTLLLTYTKPKSFSGSDSVEIQYDKQFENMCLMLSQHLHVNPKSFTVLEYYNAFEYIKEQAKKASRKSQNKAI